MNSSTLRPGRSVSVALAVALAMVVSLAWAPPADASLRFSDVSDSNVFSSDIDWLASRGVTAGCNPPANDRFCPDNPVTRAQMASFLTRALDLDEGPMNFDDVDADSPHVADIGALAGAGITRGCNPPVNTRFCPDKAVTRGQMAAFLGRALELPRSSTSFSDTSGHTFEADISALASAGITRGCNPPDNTRFCPDEPVTRAQMAAFVRRALPNLPAVVKPGANLVSPTSSTYQPSISDDGRYIAFTVWDGSSNSIRVVDREAETLQDLSPGPSGTSFTHPTLSGDGQWILVFAARGDTEALWLVDRGSDSYDVIDDNLAFGGTDDSVDVSFDGRYVVFNTGNPARMSNPEGSSEMFRWDRVSGDYEPLSVDSAGHAPSQGAIGWGRISDNGTEVMFESNQPDMAADTPSHGGIYPTYLYVHDFTSGVTELVSRNQMGNPIGGVIYSAFSDDGSTVAYEIDGAFVVRDLGPGTIHDVPLPSNVQILNRTELSTDGSVLAYFADRLEPGEDFGQSQLYSWDATTDTTRLLTRSASGEPADRGALANVFFPGGPALSGNGQWAAFTSMSTNLGASQPEGEGVAAHVFVTEATPAS